MAKRLQPRILSAIEQHQLTFIRWILKVNKFNDQAGARPKLFGSRDVNKPDMQNTNIDIEGSMPRQLHMGNKKSVSVIGLEKEEYNLRTDDIKGTKPNVMKDTIRTKRITNPLIPEYTLSSVEQRPPTPPKFMRDNININVKDFLKEK